MSSLPTLTAKPSVEPPLSIAAPTDTSVFAVLSANLFIWGKKSALAVIDQALTSGAGFGVNLLLARWLTGEAYGAFAVAFAAYIFVAGFHNVLLLEPLSVMGPSRHSAKFPSYFRAQIILHILLTGVLSLAAVVVGLILWRVMPGSPLIGAILGAAAALPFLLFLWLTRRMCYVLRRPAAAVLGSAFYLLFVGASLFVFARFGRIGSFSAFLLMGLASVLSAFLLLWRLGLTYSELRTETGVTWRAAMTENWTYGRWLVGATVLYSALTQTQMFLVAAWLGLGAAGILRAMQLPGFVMSQVVVATSLLFLPTFSSDFGRGAILRMRHKAMLVSLGLTAASLGFAIVLEIFQKPVEHLFFGGKYANNAWLVPFLALIPVANAFSTGYSMALRASQKPHFDLVSNGVVAPIALLSAFCFIYWRGLVGAAASMLLSSFLLSVMTCICFYVFSNRTEAAAGNTLSSGRVFSYGAAIYKSRQGK